MLKTFLPKHSLIFFGDWDFSALDLIYQNMTYLPDEQGWAFEAENAIFDGVTYDNFTNPSAVLSSAYQGIGVPSDVYADVVSKLEENGFVCIKDPYGRVTDCQASKLCSEVEKDLPSLQIEFVRYPTQFSPEI